MVNVAFEERGLYRGGPASKHKAGNLEVQNWGVSRYLVYLNNRAAGKGSVKTIDLCDQKTAPLTPKSFIYNRRSYSQAGRRGFESLLPLHPFNNLREFGFIQKPAFRGNGVRGCAEPIEKNELEELTSSMSGRQSSTGSHLPDPHSGWLWRLHDSGCRAIRAHDCG